MKADSNLGKGLIHFWMSPMKISKWYAEIFRQPRKEFSLSGKLFMSSSIDGIVQGSRLIRLNELISKYTAYLMFW